MDQMTQDPSSPFGPETFIRSWQHAGMRILRAQERMLQGVTSAAKLEMRFGQDLMESRLALLNWSETDSSTRSGQAMQEVDKLVALMREVTEELRSGFTEAARLLADATEEAAETAQETFQAGAAEASNILHKNAEAVRETTARTQRNVAKASEIGTELTQDSLARAKGIVTEA